MDKHKFINMEPINKGWSGDKKYCAEDYNGMKYLLRISPFETYETKKQEFKVMREVASLGIPMCRPLEFGTCEKGVYFLQNFIEGRDLEEVILSFSDDKIYAYGLEAGRILKLIHFLPAPIDRRNWDIYYNEKIDRKIRQYRECPVKYPEEELFIDYINANRDLLKNRPQCFQHGDYHSGNMMIDCCGNLTIIDFDRYDYGDPWEEFNRIVWSAQASPLFASGIVGGYFSGDVPYEFWRLLLLYVSGNILSSLPWALAYGKEEVDTMYNLEKMILGWHNNMNDIVPNWYIRRD